MNDSALIHAEHPADMQIPDMERIALLLRSGRKDDCRAVLNTFLDAVGRDQFESLMMRLYIAMDIYLSARSFAAELQVENERFVRHFGGIDDLSERLVCVSSTIEYLACMLEQCVEWRISYSGQNGNSVLEKARAYIASHYNCDDISLKSAAAAVNLSPTYFSALFKKQAGQSFVDYLTQVRLDKAKELLCCTSMQVCEIAYRVGFKDYRYFSQLFKKHTGLAPREFKGRVNNRR